MCASLSQFMICIGELRADKELSTNEWSACVKLTINRTSPTATLEKRL